MRKPFFMVKVEAEYVPFEVFVNGGFVTTDLTGTYSLETRPINHYLRSGTNQIALLLYNWQLEPDAAPSIDERARVALRIVAREVGDPDEREFEIMSIRYDGSAHGTPAATSGSSPAGGLDSLAGFDSVSTGGDVKLGPVELHEVDTDHKVLIIRELTLPLPFPEWAFLRSDPASAAYDLTESQIMPHYYRLMDEYEQIWRLLQSRSYDTLMPLFEERSSEIDAATFQEPGSTQERLRSALERAMQDSSQELAPIQVPDTFWKYDVGPMGMLRRLSRGAHSTPIIRLLQKGDPRFATGFDIAFRKVGDKFIVSR